MTTWQLVLVSCVTLILIIYVMYAYKQWRVDTRTTPLDLPARIIEWTVKCTENEARDTICVGLTCYQDVASLHETIYSLYLQAACAKRVYVRALVHGHEKTREQIMRRYKSICANRGSPEMSTHIAIRCFPVEHALGAAEARRQLFTLFDSDDCKFVLLVHTHTSFGANWDVTLLASLASTSENDGNTGRHVITTILPEAICGATGNEALTFPCFFPNKALFVPGIRGRVALGPASVRAYPVIVVSSQLVFGHAKELARLFAGSNKHGFYPFFNKDIQDLFLTLQLWTAGFDFFGPIAHVASHTKALPIAHAIGQRPRSDHGSSRMRALALSVLMTSIIKTMATEKAAEIEDHEEWLGVFLEEPYKCVAAAGLDAKITLQTENYIEESIRKSLLPKAVAERFQSEKKLSTDVPAVTGDVYERMRYALENPISCEVALTTSQLARTMKMNPLIANAFQNTRRTIESYWHYCGYDWVNNELAGRSILGLCENADKNTIIARYNSIAQYHVERQKWCAT
jgi:hypothetical protein